MTALVRDNSKAAYVATRGARPVVGTLADPNTYRPAADAQDGYIHTAFDTSGSGVAVDRSAIETLLASARRPSDQPEHRDEGECADDGGNRPVHQANAPHSFKHNTLDSLRRRSLEMQNLNRSKANDSIFTLFRLRRRRGHGQTGCL